MKDAIRFSSNPPQLIIIVGPCRTGTTALANNFVQAGIKSYMQPIKSMRRAEESGDQVVPWYIEAEEFAITKETIGPDIPAVFFDPAQILLDLGYPKEKMQLIPIVRDPRQTYASWKRMWGNVEFQGFIQSYELTSIIRENAENKALKVIPYVHEVIRDNPVDVVVPRLFKKIGLTATHQSGLSNWGAFKEGGDNLRFYDDPPEKFIEGIEKRGGYRYQDLPFNKSDTRFIEENPKLYMIYESFRKSCEIALELTINAI